MVKKKSKKDKDKRDYKDKEPDVKNEERLEKRGKPSEESGTPLVEGLEPIRCEDGSQFTCTKKGSEAKCTDGKKPIIPRGACNKKEKVKCNQKSDSSSTNSVEGIGGNGNTTEGNDT
ncbi:hypothetical protein CROQUDRAFT_132998 [Cronartium quercuum f. sp. fusiforme G11]|uniref:Uncharacterized protein n=1 Tax=Cronartium quercuum f. sp. fusiforme G11 TaxID=708437 RepID=A0A9P6TBW1_9BASI|nr:hypothetical protein CROQUDRAFT_132998 [Cronartium quercuum f. sp. fusiforme G11]